MRTSFVVLYALILIMLSSSIFVRPTSAQTQSTFTLGVGGVSSSDLNTLNPTALTVYDGRTYIPMMAIYDRLVQSSVNVAPIPDLAQSWSYPNDTTLVFNLVRNATWHDGQPFTADDVVYTLNLYLAHPEFYAANGIDKVKSVSAIDRYTVQVNMIKPDVTLIEYMAEMYILPKHIWANLTNMTSFANANPIGTGPFKFVSWGGPGTYVELTANPDYFYGKPHIDHLIVKGYASYSAVVLALTSGEIDYAALLIPPALVPQLNSQAGVEVISKPDARYFYLSFNQYANGTGNPTLRDKNVRLALSYAVDTAELSQVVWQGYATSQSTVMPVVFKDWINPNISSYGFNLAKAAQILDNAGYKVGSDGIRVSPNGVRMSYKIEVPNSFSEEYRGAQLIAGWWKQIGVEANPSVIDQGTLGDEISSWKQDIFIWDWVGMRTDWYVSMFTTSQAGPAPNNGLSDCGYSNPTYDALFQLQSQQIDPAQRRDTFYKMEQILHDDAVYIPLYTTSTIQAIRSDRFTGLTGGILPPVTVYTATNLLVSVTPIITVQSATTAAPVTTTTSAGMYNNTILVAGAVVVVVVALAIVATRKKASAAVKTR